MSTTGNTITVTGDDCGAAAEASVVPAQRLARLLGRRPVPEGWDRIAGQPVCPICRVEQ